MPPKSHSSSSHSSSRSTSSHSSSSYSSSRSTSSHSSSSYSSSRSSSSYSSSRSKSYTSSQSKSHTSSPGKASSYSSRQAKSSGYSLPKAARYISRYEQDKDATIYSEHYNSYRYVLGDDVVYADHGSDMVNKPVSSLHYKGRGIGIFRYHIIRKRYHQPSGYVPENVGGMPVVVKYCRFHDYHFYSTDWTNTETGVQYKMGYYDENGRHHNNLIFDHGSYSEEYMTCGKCGQYARIYWKHDDTLGPVCTNCNSNPGKLESYEVAYELDKKVLMLKESIFTKLLDIPGVIRKHIKRFLIVAFIVMCYFVGKDKEESYKPESDSCYYGDSMYVSDLYREAYWDYDTETYYDEETDCYFLFNNGLEEPKWQYWYEGISSDYLESGWMEYDEDEDLWYIEVMDRKWRELPQRYISSRLWHM